MKRSFLFRSFVVVTVAVGANGCLADKRTLTIGPGDAGSTDDGPRQNPEEDASTEPGETLPCDPVKQAGCLPARKCTLNTKDEAVCGNNGTRKTGQSCSVTFPDTCQQGSVCSGPTTASAFCRQFCSKTADCTQPAPSGQPTNDPVCAFDFGKFKVCSTPCNPVPAFGLSGCLSGGGCVFGNFNGVYFTDCNHVAGAGTDGVPCSKQSECADGYLCATNKCRSYCRTGFNSDCMKSGYTCEAGNVAGLPFGVCCPPSPAPC